MGPGESKVVSITSGSWEGPRPFKVAIPSEWVKRYTKAGNRKVVITWKDSHLEIFPVEVPE